jgi:hypothetical protein
VGRSGISPLLITGDGGITETLGLPELYMDLAVLLGTDELKEVFVEGIVE